MAKQDNGGSSAINTAQNVSQAVSDAKDTAKAVMKAAKQSKGNVYAFAAAMAKEMIKDPKLFLKALKTALILILGPFLAIVLVIACFGAALLAFIQQIITDIANYVIENNGSWGNIDWDLTGGLLVAGGHALCDLITGPDDAEDDATGRSYTVDEGYDVDAEMNIMHKEDAPGKVLTKRIAMIKRSAEARRLQYLILFEPLCTLQAVVEGIFHLAGMFFDDPSFMIIEDVSVYDDMTDVTDLDAVAILCAYSVSKDVSFEDIAVIDLRYWIGHYSGIGSVFGLNERVKPRSSGTPDTFDFTSVAASSEDGANTSVISLNTSWIRVPKWFGTFVPQYVLEQIHQDKVMDDRIQAGVATPEEIASGQGYNQSSTGTKPTYPSGRGLIDDLIVLEHNPTLVFTDRDEPIGDYYAINNGCSTLEDFKNAIEATLAYGADFLIESLEYVWDNFKDALASAGNWLLGLVGIEPVFDEDNAPDFRDVLNDIGVIKIVSVYLYIPLRVNHYEDIVTNVIGLWKGPLEDHDASGKNREFAAKHSEDANKLLYYQWTDNRGVTYTRQRGYQYENYMDSLEALSAEYHLGFTRPKLTSGGQSMADMAMAQYEEYGGQSESILGPHYWSIYYGSTSNSTAAWCCCFVYCCGLLLDKQLGGDSHLYVGTNDSALGPLVANCGASWDYFAGKNRTHQEQTYIPQPGDLIYFSPQGLANREHIGVVINVEPNGNVRVVEGNSGDTLKLNTYSNYAVGSHAWTSSDGSEHVIYGYTNPEYPDDANPDDIKVFYLASGNNDCVHMWKGHKSYGRMNAPVNVVARMMDVFQERYLEVYDSLGGGSLEIASDEFDAAWDALAASDTQGFYKAIFAAYYEVYAKDYFEKLERNFHLGLSSNRALRDLAWCAITRDGPSIGYNTFYVAMTDADHYLKPNMTQREIVDAYYTERKSNLDREITNADQRAAFTHILDMEYNYLIQEIGPNG